ncbi:uncharacterized protein EDB93DRAFT_1142956 [Suillus bovinus]|uniref:uncharacterized protein n=1 Tax=Suillus bovinus TaxID=48563 RepID=UPI001B868EA2|nr:uncharacterized protein EDB93DRAFT_1142956 [Suillus bovinus]KAG2150353.1 hypothetical protein EDB93DRAFT_1142956 [Suillus bovinus]
MSSSCQCKVFVILLPQIIQQWLPKFWVLRKFEQHLSTYLFNELHHSIPYTWPSCGGRSGAGTTLENSMALCMLIRYAAKVREEDPKYVFSFCKAHDMVSRSGLHVGRRCSMGLACG